jgi:hypothetical protein
VRGRLGAAPPVITTADMGTSAALCGHHTKPRTTKVAVRAMEVFRSHNLTGGSIAVIGRPTVRDTADQATVSHYPTLIGETALIPRVTVGEKANHHVSGELDPIAGSEPWSPSGDQTYPRLCSPVPIRPYRALVGGVVRQCRRGRWRASLTLQRDAWARRLRRGR